jgi:hypothetical protein
MIYRDPSDKQKRKRIFKPSFKSTWTVEKLLKELIQECDSNIKTNGGWSFCAEKLSEKYRAKIDIVRAAIQGLRLNIQHGYHIYKANRAPHESSRNKFFYHGPNKSGWCATVYYIKKTISDDE